MLHLDPRGQGLNAVMEIGEDKVTITTSEGETFIFDLADVQCRPYDTCMATIDIVGNDLLYFAAEDPLDFAARAIDSLNVTPETRTQSRRRIPVPTLPTRRLPVIGNTNGADDWDGATQPAPTPTRRRRRRKNNECTHIWRTLQLPGGLVRRVCDDCGHVSIDLTNA